MGKTLILSNRQLNEIIGDGCYLSNNSKPSNIHSNETGVDGTIDNQVKATTDKIADRMVPDNNGLFKGVGRGYVPVANAMEECYSKKDFNDMLLREMNSQLDNVNINVVIPGDNPSNNINLGANSEENLAYKKTMAKQSGDRKAYQAIDTALKTQRDRIESDKRSKAAAGMPNQFQKAGGTKKNTGTAHTPKNNSKVTILKPIDNNN